MIELIYFSKTENQKKAYHVIQPRRGEPWEIVEGDELIGKMEKSQGFWNLRTWAEIPEGLCTELAKLIESQNFNKLPEDIKTHWPGKVQEVVVISDAEYLVICKPETNLERFVKPFSAYAPHLLKDEWPILFRVYDAGMNEDFEVNIQGARR